MFGHVAGLLEIIWTSWWLVKNCGRRSEKPVRESCRYCISSLISGGRFEFISCRSLYESADCLSGGKVRRLEGILEA